MFYFWQRFGVEKRPFLNTMHCQLSSKSNANDWWFFDVDVCLFNPVQPLFEPYSHRFKISTDFVFIQTFIMDANYAIHLLLLVRCGGPIKICTSLVVVCLESITFCQIQNPLIVAFFIQVWYNQLHRNFPSPWCSTRLGTPVVITLEMSICRLYAEPISQVRAVEGKSSLNKRLRFHINITFGLVHSSAWTWRMWSYDQLPTALLLLWNPICPVR